MKIFTTFKHQKQSADGKSLEQTVDDLSRKGEPSSRGPKASGDKASRLISVSALILSATSFYYSSLRRVDSLSIFSDGRIYASIEKSFDIEAKIPDTFYFSNSGTRPIAIIYIHPNIIFECENGNKLTIGDPLSLSAVSIDPGKIVPVHVSPSTFVSHIYGCNTLKSIIADFTVDVVNTAGVTTRSSLVWTDVGSNPVKTGVVFRLEGATQLLPISRFGFGLL